MAAVIPAGALAPEFDLPSSDGGVLRFTRGGTDHTFIVFWESGCPICRSWVPELSRVLRGYPEAPARIIGVAVGNDTCQSAESFRQATGFVFPAGLDEAGAVRALFGLERVPAVVLTTPDGVVLRKYLGARGEIALAIDQALDAIGKGISVPLFDLGGDTCAIGDVHAEPAAARPAEGAGQAVATAAEAVRQVVARPVEAVRRAAGAPAGRRQWARVLLFSAPLVLLAAGLDRTGWLWEARAVQHWGRRLLGGRRTHEG